VACLQCKKKIPRDEFQAVLQAVNPTWLSRFRTAPSTRPDGDADLGVVIFNILIFLIFTLGINTNLDIDRLFGVCSARLCALWWNDKT
jgi:hypothetical protein